MTSTRAGRVRRSESDWRKILAHYGRSGKTQEAFCRDAGIAPTTFQSWSRRLRAATAPAEFIDVTPAGRDSWSIEIAFADGTTARLRG